ncbi:MAG: cation-translocating P-type ATPase, partial [Clostridiales bacterium]|nr:cation-translocating P-type ATPase [Clostridiales bacterium]
MKTYSREALSTGLTAAEVKSRIRDGQVNKSADVPTRSVSAIVRGNIVTLFNILNFILAALVLITGSYKNMLFMGVIFCNILIGTVQEIRAKRTIDKLSLISAPKAAVLRDGQELHIAISELVLDDLMLLRAGQQVCADSVVLSGECEVNESLI